MTDPDAWLKERQAGVPASLAERMRRYVADGPPAPPADRLAQAARAALRAALDRPDERASALDLLAADALITAAFEAAAQDGPAAVDRLAAASAPGAIVELLTGQS